MAVLLAAAGAPEVAHAGTYDVWSCRDATGAALSASAWVPEDRVSNACATGGSRRVRPAGDVGGSLRVTPEGATGLAPPAGTRIAGYELWRSAEDDTDPDDTNLIET